MGRLRQTAIRRSRTGAALSRPLYPSRRHLQSSIARLRRRQRHVPLEGLCSRKHAAHDDHHRRRVHPPVPAARAPEGLCPHPALRLHGQLPAIHIVRTLPPTPENGAGSSSTEIAFDNFGAVVSYLSGSIDCHRETDCSSDRLEIRLEMLFRYVVAKIPNRIVMTCCCTPAPTCVFIRSSRSRSASDLPATTLQHRLLVSTFVFAADFPLLSRLFP